MSSLVEGHARFLDPRSRSRRTTRPAAPIRAYESDHASTSTRSSPLGINGPRGSPSGDGWRGYLALPTGHSDPHMSTAAVNLRPADAARAGGRSSERPHRGTPGPVVELAVLVLQKVG